MARYTILASILEQRVYEVSAASEEAAKDIVAENLQELDFELLDREIDTLEVTD